MGRKKQPARDDGSIAAQQGGGNSKKKGFVIGDDEYSIGTESEELLIQEEKVGGNAGKKSKKNSKSVKLKVEEEGDQLEEEEDLPALMISGKKSKAKKGVGGSVFSSSAFGLLDENGEDDDADVSALTGTSNDDDDDVPAMTFTGNKKSSKVSKKGGSNLFSAAAFEVVDNDGSEVLDSRENGQKSEDDELPVISFTGKKKSSKARKKNVDALIESTVAGLDERGVGKNEKKEEDEEEVLVSFSGKKKKSSKGLKNTGNSFSAALLNEESMEEVSQLANKSGDTSVDEFQCKAEDADAVAFSGMKKTFKKTSKDVSGAVTLDAGIVNEISNPAGTETLSTNTVADELRTNRTEVVESSKSKRKKKKSGRTAQEEDDLDRILAELGEGPPAEPASLNLAQEGKTQVAGPETVATADATVEKEGDNEVVESAAAKKKKKKKEKEKEKKAAAAEASTAALAPSQAKGDKKVPKHIREMQEALARLREAEERKKIEEEERQRKEEEERRRQEELERQAEEARRRKKEREKEKLLKKKQEGRLLTGKQKEEARRLEAMRNQFLAGAGGLPPSSSETGGVAVKRPIYQTRKSKPATQPNGSAPKGDEKIEAREIPQETEGQLASSELETEEKMDIANVEENSEVADMVAENGVEEDTEDEWDAKSWDDADVILPNRGAFADEESSFEPEPTIRRKDTSAVTASRGTTPLMGAPKPAVSAKRAPFSPPTKSREVEKKNSQPDIGVEDTSRGEASLKNEAPRSGDVPERSKENLRSPICCIMGHVDTGKTKLLDCIRGTNVQGGEAGGITQQIGATYFPAENIREKTKGSKAAENLKVPGLLIIDTPGHESFTNLRSRGSGLCDIAILVVDIMHGLEPQTVESLNLLRMRNTEFIVALNKVDRLYGWKTCRNAPIKKAIEQQSKDVQNEFNERLTEIVTKFKEQGLNTELYYKNRKMRETYSIVPTSAISGEGIPDLLLLLCKWTEETMVEKLTFSEEVQCTVLEVKVIEGHGTTIDVVLVNGTLHEGDQIVVCGMQGVIVTNIRALLTPHPMKELRVKGTYLHHKEIKAAQGIKITAQGLEHAVAGTCLYVVGPDDDLEDVKEAAREDMKSVMNRIDKSDEGVYVQASTLGSLEALLEFLKSSEVKIPVSGIGIGPVHKNDVMKASVMLEKKKEYATILAFDVKVTPEARELSKEYGVKIFMADIIYHLFDQFKAYIKTVREERKREAADEAVFPCVLKIIPNCIFNKKDPIVLGVDVLEGIVKVGTPMCVPQQDFIDIGRIASIENNHKPVDFAKRGQKVAIKIVGANPDEQQKMFGRHFEVDDELVSHISRTSIDVLKANYKDDLSLDDWRLVLRLKKLFNIT